MFSEIVAETVGEVHSPVVLGPGGPDGVGQIVQVAVRASDSAEVARVLRLTGVDRKKVGLWTKPIRVPSDERYEGSCRDAPAWATTGRAHVAALAAWEQLSASRGVGGARVTHKTANPGERDDGRSP